MQTSIRSLRSLFVFLLSLAPIPVHGQTTAPPPPTLLPSRLHSTVEFLASDALEGRAAGEPGAERAARFVASEFLRYGLRPAGPDGTFFQRFDCGVRRLGEKNSLSIEGGSDSSESLVLGTDWLPMLFSPSGEAQGEIEFAGHGLSDPARGDVLAGKIALVVRGLPYSSEETDARATYLAKARAMAESKAAAVIFTGRAGDGSDDRVLGREIWPSFDASTGFFTLGLSFLTMFSGMKKELADYNMTSAELTEQSLILSQYRGPLGSSSIPALFVSRRTAERLLGGPGSIEARLGGKPAVSPPCRIRIRTDVVGSGKTTANVAALLEGSDPVLRDEVVVVGAHYDHVGKNAEGEVWNGADDNASGTSVLLGLAATFASEPLPPRRSILFLAFAAEEKGLLGSLNYLDDPLVPLAKTVAMVNLDMVGRNKPDHVTMIGARSSPEMKEAAERLAPAYGLTLDDDGEEFFDQSDHAGFYHRRIPVLFFCSMEHEDYHHATDTADKIDADKMSRIAGLTASIVREIADAGKRPTFDGYREKRKQRGFSSAMLDGMFSDRLRR